VEARVRRVLTELLESTHELFNQTPGIIKDAWVQMTLHDDAKMTGLIVSPPLNLPLRKVLWQ